MITIPLKRVASIIAGQSPSSEDVVPLSEGTPFLQGNAEFGQENPSPKFECNAASKHCDANDILLSVRAPVGALNVADRRYAIGRGLCAIRAVGVDQRYLWWWANTQGAFLESVSTGSTYTAVTAEQVGALGVPAIDTQEQRRIADFLDVETSRIDDLIAARGRVSELIDERRVAVSTQRCLRGVRVEVDVKNSGIGPLGRIPSHWSVVRNKNIFREINDPSVDGSEELLTVSHLTGVTPRSEKSVYMFMAESMVGYKKCQPGDLVINTMWAWMGALGFSKYNGIVSPAYGVYRLKSDGLLPDYFDLLYGTPEYICEMTRYSKGVWSSRLRLYPESFLALSVPVPPLDEQKEIVRTIEEEVEPERRLQQEIARSNSLLLERRKALITAAVTGQIDVTTARGADLS